MRREGPVGNEAVRIVKTQHPHARAVPASDFRTYSVRSGNISIGTGHTSIDAWADAARNVLALLGGTIPPLPA